MLDNAFCLEYDNVEEKHCHLNFIISFTSFSDTSAAPQFEI